jgi:hypothetical protein
MPDNVVVATLTVFAFLSSVSKLLPTNSGINAEIDVLAIVSDGII